jgi:hypothetical protein
VDFPIKNGGFFHSYVKLPEGKSQFLLIEIQCAGSRWFNRWPGRAAAKFDRSRGAQETCDAAAWVAHG